MDKIQHYRLLCSLNSPLKPYQKSSPEQILFTSRKIRIKLSNTKVKGGTLINEKKIILFSDGY